MEKLKDIVLIGFAVVGFISILSGFTEQQVYGTPESHAWSFHLNNGVGEAKVQAFAINAVTGEVRKYETYYNSVGDKNKDRYGSYSTTFEIK